MTSILSSRETKRITMVTSDFQSLKENTVATSKGCTSSDSVSVLGYQHTQYKITTNVQHGNWKNKGFILNRETHSQDQFKRKSCHKCVRKREAVIKQSSGTYNFSLMAISSSLTISFPTIHVLKSTVYTLTGVGGEKNTWLCILYTIYTCG